MANQKRIDLAIDAILNDNPVEALGHLMLHKIEIVKEVVEAPTVDEFRQAVANGEYTTDLPPIQPLKDRPTKAIDVSCPTCGAKPGKPCVKVSTRGRDGGVLGEPLITGKKHAARRYKVGGK